MRMMGYSSSTSSAGPTYLSGNQTRRIRPLVDHYPEPRVELHPKLAARLENPRRR
jgi:hypothetical protein